MDQFWTDEGADDAAAVGAPMLAIEDRPRLAIEDGADGDPYAVLEAEAGLEAAESHAETDSVSEHASGADEEAPETVAEDERASLADAAVDGNLDSGLPDQGQIDVAAGDDEANLAGKGPEGSTLAGNEAEDGAPASCKSGKPAMAEDGASSLEAAAAMPRKEHDFNLPEPRKLSMFDLQQMKLRLSTRKEAIR